MRLRDFERHSSRLALKTIESFIIVEQRADSRQQVCGDRTVAADPIHQRPVVGPQLLGQQADVVLGFCVYYSAEYRGQVVGGRLVLDVTSNGSNAASF